MAIDRELSLRRAEKLLRQGRLDGAIEEYERLVEDQPHDWNTRNLLGDLYVRAGQVERAVAQFTRIADHFAQEGFFSRAVALYKKVVKIKPDDEHALLQSAEVAARQGLLVDAKACLGAIAEQRRRRGDRDGAAEITLRIAALDPSDIGARLSAARVAAERGDGPAAAARYKEIATELLARGRGGEAVEALAEAVRVAPADVPARDWLVRAYLQQGDVEAARAQAASAGQFAAVVDALVAVGRSDAARDALTDAVARHPADTDMRARLARMLIATGDLDRASGCLRPDDVGDDATLLLLSAELALRQGRVDEGRHLLRAVVDRAGGPRENLVLLGCSLAENDADAAFACIDIAADAAVADRDWPAAAAALQEFVRRVPGHIPSLIRLVDVCVDGDLDEPLLAAQSELADRYLEAGRAAEARVIAEDLLVRRRDEASIARFRRVLDLLGEGNPDALIADRLSADTMVDGDDLALEGAPPRSMPPGDGQSGVALEPAPAGSGGVDSALVEPTTIAAEPLIAGAEPRETGGVTGGPGSDGVADNGSIADWPRSNAPGGPPGGVERHNEMAVVEPASGTAGLDARDGLPCLQEDGATPGLQPANETPAVEDDVGEGTEVIEIDLSRALTDLQQGARPVPAHAGRPITREVDLDEVFQDFREEVMREQATSIAAQHYRLALTYVDMGMPDEAAKRLEIAARTPRYRFHAASLLGRIHRQHGRGAQAIEWFERAAETPAPSADAARALLYELGQTLEEARESARALAVYLELQADAGEYRDVAERIERLTQPATGD